MQSVHITVKDGKEEAVKREEKNEGKKTKKRKTAKRKCIQERRVLDGRDWRRGEEDGHEGSRKSTLRCTLFS